MEFLASYWWIFLILSIIGPFLGFFLVAAGQFDTFRKTRSNVLAMFGDILFWIVGAISAPLFLVGVIVAIIQFVKG